jgi:hypothetical protein
LSNWQTKVGVWGFLIWLASFPLGGFLQKHDYQQLAFTAFGYSLGFLTVFAGHIFWGYIIKGRWSELMGDGVCEKAISGFTLFIIFTFGLIGVLTGIFHSNPWSYSLTFAIGGFVVNQGLMPLMNHLDGND